MVAIGLNAITQASGGYCEPDNGGTERTVMVSAMAVNERCGAVATAVSAPVSERCR